VAEGFARGHRGIVVSDPVIATAQVYKRDILAIFIERKESEVLIDPRRTEISLRRWRPR
jgi:non-ribosomal peptide synthetase component F